MNKERDLPMKLEKTTKFFYYVKGFGLMTLPHRNFREKIAVLKKRLTPTQLTNVKERVDYYCKVSGSHPYISGKRIKDLKKPKTPKAYYFDTYEYARFFDPEQLIDFVFGDVTHVPESASIVKSRPIVPDNQNSVVLNLDKARHFAWVRNDKDFRLKKNLLIGRGAIFNHQQHRIDFYQKYFNHPMVDLGKVNDNGEFNQWMRPSISIEEHLNYKFILSLQGNDVATNLKWIMSSNSIAVMPKPTMETWFMEGRLIGGIHYIEIKDDYSDLEEKLNYYITHEEECQKIIENAHQYCNQFFNQNVEDLCSLEVLKKYFDIQ